jgi:hypothetical protein
VSGRWRVESLAQLGHLPSPAYKAAELRDKHTQVLNKLYTMNTFNYPDPHKMSNTHLMNWLRKVSWRKHLDTSKYIQVAISRGLIQVY